MTPAYDGPTLRAVRESAGVPLRRVARHAGMSHGHLSKVERGEYGRPVTPAIMAAYERATGRRLADAVAAVAERGELSHDRRRTGKGWRPGQLSALRRRGYSSAIAALSMGAYLGEPVGRLLDSTGRPLAPVPPDQPDLAHLEQLGEYVTTLDLRFGGALVSQYAKALLRWAVPMLDVIDVSEPDYRRLHAAIGRVAHRVAWAAFDAYAHEPARSLFRLALHAAVVAGDPDLRAHVVADVAAQHNHLGYHHDALEIIRLVEADERVVPPVRAVIQTVKARTFAALDDREGCLGCIKAAEQHHQQADGDGGLDAGWVATLRHPGLMYAGTGHALATLAVHTGYSEDALAAEAGAACQQLASAVETLHPTGHARAHALCLVRLALLRLVTGELDEAGHWARLALSHAAGIGSRRLDRALAAVRATATKRYPDEPVMRQLVEQIDAVTGKPVSDESKAGAG